MKRIIFVSVIILLIIYNFTNHENGKEDIESKGNSIYKSGMNIESKGDSICKRGMNITSGLDIDKELERLVFIGSYGDDCYKRLFSIPLTGEENITKPKYEYSIFSDLIYRRVMHLYRYLSKTKQLFTRNYYYKYQVIGEYNPSNGTLNPISSHWKPYEFDINEDTNTIVATTSRNSIILFENIKPIEIDYIESMHEKYPYSTLYSSNSSFYLSSANIATHGNDIYVAMNNILYKGSLKCRNCTVDDLKPIFTFESVPLNGIYTFFDRIQITNDHIYFINNGNVYRISQNGDKIKVYNNVKDISVYKDHLYFISGNKIFKASSQKLESDPEILFDGNIPIECNSIPQEGTTDINGECDLSKTTKIQLDSKFLCIPKSTEKNSHTVYSDGKCFPSSYPDI